MRTMTSCVLIAFNPDAHEVGTDPVAVRRSVKCQELSLTQAEVYQSGGEGLSPEAKLLIPYDRDYKGERELEYRGERWRVLRNDPYKDWNGVILLIRRKKGNSGQWTPPADPVTTETEPAEVGG
jgi:SPP1 family predicted phage head-tail adaptor